jgi:hypothetical protein
VRQSFVLKVSDLDRVDLFNIRPVSSRADAVESVLDPKTKAELLRRWLCQG